MSDEAVSDEAVSDEAVSDEAVSDEARAEVLARIRGALRDVPEDERREDVPVARDYARAGERSRDAVLELFEDRLRDYRATVRRAAADADAGAGGLSEAISDACRELGVRRLAVPAGGVPAEWQPAGLELVEDDHLSALELDALDGALTGCAVAIASTGTLVLDGQGLSGRRLLTLVPDNHVCVVRADQVVESVPEALALVGGSVRERAVPITLVSGPSASSDIELTRVEGVHGPRNLFVLIAA